MRNLASVFLLVLLLPGFLATGPPIGATPVLAREPISGRSHAEGGRAAGVPGGLSLAKAGGGNPDEIHPVNPAESPATVDNICNTLAAAAAENDLPIDFFTRLIWQESRFDPAAVSRAGA